MGNLIKPFVKSPSIPKQWVLRDYIDNVILYPLSGTNHHTSAINHDVMLKIEISIIILLLIYLLLLLPVT